MNAVQESLSREAAVRDAQAALNAAVERLANYLPDSLEWARALQRDPARYGEAPPITGSDLDGYQNTVIVAARFVVRAEEALLPNERNNVGLPQLEG